VQYLLVEAENPTIEFLPWWHTSIPITITLNLFINSGNLTLIDSPPILEFIYFIILDATDILNFFTVLLRTHYDRIFILVKIFLKF